MRAKHLRRERADPQPARLAELAESSKVDCGHPYPLWRKVGGALSLAGGTRLWTHSHNPEAKGVAFARCWCQTFRQSVRTPCRQGAFPSKCHI